MRRGLVIAALAASLLPTVSRAESSGPDVAQVFVRMCGETRGDPAGAMALADAQGWKPPMIPLGALAAAVPGLSKFKMKYRIKADGGRTLILMAGTLADKGAERRTCAVAVAGGGVTFATLRTELSAWTQVPPLATHEAANRVVFGFMETPRGHEALAAGDDPLSGNPPKTPAAAVVILTTVQSVSMVVYVSGAA